MSENEESTQSECDIPVAPSPAILVKLISNHPRYNVDKVGGIYGMVRQAVTPIHHSEALGFVGYEFRSICKRSHPWAPSIMDPVTRGVDYDFVPVTAEDCVKIEQLLDDDFRYWILYDFDSDYRRRVRVYINNVLDCK